PHGVGTEGGWIEVRCRGGPNDAVDAKHRASHPPLSGYIRGNGCSPARGSKKKTPRVIATQGVEYANNAALQLICRRSATSLPPHRRRARTSVRTSRSPSRRR